jgi:hypothetical protein
MEVGMIGKRLMQKYFYKIEALKRALKMYSWK